MTIRSNDPRPKPSIRTVRFTSLATLACYPAGALTLALGPDTLAASIVGYGLILLALIGAVSLARSPVQRIVAEDAGQLDEYEVALRRRAMTSAYSVLSVLALLMVIYAAIASDAGGWVPSTYEEYNGVFWGVFLYSSTIPTVTLAWALDPAADQLA